MFEPLSVDIVGSGKSMHFFGRGVCTIVRMQSFANRIGVQNSSHLKLTKFESIDRRLQLAIQWSRHFHPPCFTPEWMLSSWDRVRSRRQWGTNGRGFLLSLIGLMLTSSKSREINDGPKTAQVD